MSKRPLIGYATRSGVTSPGYAAPRFANNESYAGAIADAGGAPLMIPSIADEEALAALYETLDGLLLTGGPDIDPARYGQERHPRTDGGDAAMEHADRLAQLDCEVDRFAFLQARADPRGQRDRRRLRIG